MTNFQKEVLKGIVVFGIFFGCMFYLSGCSTLDYEEGMTEYENTCRGEEADSERCEDLQDALIRIEDRRAAKQRKEEEERAMVVFCKSQGLVLYCESRSMDKRCQCASAEAIRDALF